jgi:VIT1/CCC1 family predicted Fe2+/Mn2+ transporter
MQVFFPDLEATQFPTRVVVRNTSLDTTLTATFHDPNSLQNATTLFASYEGFSVDAGTPLSACMIGFETTKLSVLVAVILALLVTATAGVLASYLTGGIEIGWALRGGMIGLIAAFDMILLWLLK